MRAAQPLPTNSRMSQGKFGRSASLSAAGSPNASSSRTLGFVCVLIKRCFSAIQDFVSRGSAPKLDDVRDVGSVGPGRAARRYLMKDGRRMPFGPVTGPPKLLLHTTFDARP